MSRCHKWNSAFEGIVYYLQSKGVAGNNHNFKVESNIFNNYCKEKNISGSFSERVLKVSAEFKSFKEWFKKKRYIKAMNQEPFTPPHRDK